MRDIGDIIATRGRMMNDERMSQQVDARDSNYAALIDALPDLMFRLSRDGRYLDYVSGADEALALPPEQFLGKCVREVLPDMADMIEQAIAETLATGSTVRFEYQIAVPMGSTNIRDCEARMVKSGDDEVLAIIRDVTEHVQMAITLLDQQSENGRLELLNQIALALSHHIRNAVSPILLYADQLDHSDPASGERLKKAALEQGRRIAAIASAIDQMVTTGEVPTTSAWGEDSPEMLDLEPLIERYLNSL